MENTTPTKLSVIVPVYNEERHLSRVIDLLMRSACPLEREWIFVDDHSSDDSLQILRAHAPRWGYQVIAQPKNEGKGSAIRAGIKHASGDLILIQDADFEYDPADIPKLLEPLLLGQADVVFGSRFKKSSFQVHRTYHYFVNRTLTVLSNLFSGVYLTDMETCYKVFRADLLKAMNLQSRRFEIEVEMTAYMAKLRTRVYELPISYYPRTKLQGKKINWRDGVLALYYLIRYNLFTSVEDAYTSVPLRFRQISDEYAEGSPASPVALPSAPAPTGQNV